MSGICPVERKHRLAFATDTDSPSSRRYITPHHRLDVLLPQFIESHRPRQSIHLSATSKPAFVYNPPQRFQAVFQKHVEDTAVLRHPPQLVPRRNERHHIAELLENDVSGGDE